MKKKGGNWYSYLSGSQSTLKIHVADMKTPLLKSANHIKVCHVAFVKWLFIFISIYPKMKNTKKTPQNPPDVHFLDCCSPVALIISPTFTRQLYSGSGRGKGDWRSLLEARDFSWRGGKKLKARWWSDFSVWRYIKEQE